MQRNNSRKEKILFDYFSSIHCERITQKKERISIAINGGCDIIE
jgi:hypothetical protein